MPLRPARTCREIKKPAWTRFSKKNPRKSYVKAMPHNALQVTAMGDPNKYYDRRVDLVAIEDVQARDNALEACRQAANKYLERELSGNYFLFIRIFPHHIIREVKMIFGAGADRLQKGMKHAWGKPSDRAARIYKGTIIFSIYIKKENLHHALEACRRAKSKLPGKYKTVVVEEERGIKQSEEYEEI